MINKNQKYLMGIINSVTFQCTYFFLDRGLKSCQESSIQMSNVSYKKKDFHEFLTEKYFQNFQNFDKCCKNNFNIRCI